MSEKRRTMTDEEVTLEWVKGAKTVQDYHHRMARYAATKRWQAMSEEDRSTTMIKVRENLLKKMQTVVK